MFELYCSKDFWKSFRVAFCGVENGENSYNNHAILYNIDFDPKESWCYFKSFEYLR